MERLEASRGRDLGESFRCPEPVEARGVGKVSPDWAGREGVVPRGRMGGGSSAGSIAMAGAEGTCDAAKGGCGADIARNMWAGEHWEAVDGSVLRAM